MYYKCQQVQALLNTATDLLGGYVLPQPRDLAAAVAVLGDCTLLLRGAMLGAQVLGKGSLESQAKALLGECVALHKDCAQQDYWNTLQQETNKDSYYAELLANG